MFAGVSAFQMGLIDITGDGQYSKANRLGASKRMTASQGTEPPRLAPGDDRNGAGRAVPNAKLSDREAPIPAVREAAIEPPGSTQNSRSRSLVTVAIQCCFALRLRRPKR